MRPQDDGDSQRDPNAASLAHVSGVVKGAAINIGGSLAGRAVALVYTVFLARILTTAEVGLYYLGLTLFQLLTALAVLGLDSGILRYVPIYQARSDPGRMVGTVRLALRLALPFSCLLGIVLFLGARRLAEGSFHDAALAPLLWSLAPAIPFFVAGSILLAGTQALQRMEYQVYTRQLGEPILRFGLTVVLFLAGLRLAGVAISFTVSCIVGAWMAWHYQRRLYAGAGRGTIPTEWREILHFSLPEIFSRFLFLLFVGTDTMILGHLSTPDQVGLYNVASRTVFVGVYFVEAFSVMFIPMISTYHEQRDLQGLQRVYQSVTKWITMLSVPIFLGLAVLPREILGIYGDAYLGGAASMAILCVGYLSYAATGPAGAIVTMTGRSWLTLVNTASIVLVNALLNWILIPKWGIGGAAFATMTSMFLLNLVRLLQVRIFLGIHPYRVTFLKPLLAGAIAAMGAWFARGWAPAGDGPAGLFVGGGVLLAVYVAALVVLGFDVEDRFILDRLRAKLATLGR